MEGTLATAGKDPRKSGVERHHRLAHRAGRARLRLERGAQSRLLNQSVVRPDGWLGVVPGGEGRQVWAIPAPPDAILERLGPPLFEDMEQG